MRAVTIAVAAALILAGCGRKPDDSHQVTINGKDGTVTVSGNGEHFTVKSADGQATVDINGAGAATKMPAFAPLYPGAKVTASMTSSANGGMVTFETGSAAADIIAFYKQKAAGSGLTDNMDTNMGGSLMYAASAGDGKKGLQVVAVKSGEGTHVQVTWSDK